MFIFLTAFGPAQAAICFIQAKLAISNSVFTKTAILIYGLRTTSFENLP